jgi:hypothetical protein
MLALGQWLEDFSNCYSTNLKPEGDDLERLVKDCFAFRKSSFFSYFRYFIRQGREEYRDFQRLLKLLGKIQLPTNIATCFVEAAETFPVDFVEGYEISVVTSPAKRRVPLPSDLTIEDIMHEVFTREEQEKFLNRLRMVTMGDISKILKTKCNFKTLVHAELLMADYFYQNRHDYVADDMYIACSKYACFCCHSYLRYHPGFLTIPPTHHKIYKGWRAPYADSDDTILRERDEKILQQMIGQLRKELWKELDNRKPRRSSRANTPPPP